MPLRRSRTARIAVESAAMLYSLKDLEEALGRELVARARVLADADGLESPLVQRGGELVTALIRGLGRKPLRVYVRIREQPQGVRIEGECTCSQRRNCLHVAAVLLKALEWEQPDVGSPLLAGHEGASGTGPGAEPPEPEAAGLPRLVYLLSPNLGAEPGVRIETFAVRGGLGAASREARPYTPAWALRGVPPRFLSEADLTILRDLASKSAGERGAAPVYDGASLGRILGTGRCQLAALTGPLLRRAGSRTARLRWRMGEDGSQATEWVSDADVTAIVLDDLWYVDAASGACGPLDTGLPAGLARQLQALSPLAPERSARAREALERAYGDAVPLPVALEVESLPRVEPVPHLLLETRQPEAAARTATAPVHLACLSFEYHGQLFRRVDPLCRLEGRRVLRLHRDEALEQAGIDRLQRLGFVPERSWSLETGRDCFVLPPERGDWLDFQIRVVPALQEAGWRVEVAQGFGLRVAQARQWSAELSPAADAGWFDLAIGVDTEQGRVNLLPALVRLIQEAPESFTRERLLERRHPLAVPLPDGGLLAVPLERLRPMLETLFELHDPNSLERDGRLRLNRFQLVRLAELDDQPAVLRVDWGDAERVRRVGERLRVASGIEVVEPPIGLQAGLRGYQRSGLDWLQFLRSYDLAGILADDMGLGKTVQTLAHVLLEKERGRLDEPALVVSPTSLLPNWRREAQRFAPSLRVLTLHGLGRQALFEQVPAHDLVLTTYPLLPRDRDQLLAQHFHLLILDEAQVIKNPKAQASRIVRELRARHRLCLTGTPMENHLGELWSLFDFLLPGLLGSRRQFQRLFRNPIEKDGDGAASHQLALRVRPFLLRRTKAAVVSDLPPKTEIPRGVELEGAQRDLYESIRLAMHERVRREVQDKGLGRSRIVILDSLLKLRQVCCDPRLVRLDSARGVRESAKLDLLMTLLPEMVEEGRRILLFSQFTRMLELIEEAVRDARLAYVKLTGATTDRAAPVDRFQSGQVPLFLISLKAGGVGLNLTAADTVIHYDPWWNPAVERQATDRAHRIGQDKAVFVYKLFAEGTVEERIQALQARKQALADRVFDAAAGDVPPWTDEDLEYLFG